MFKYLWAIFEILFGSSKYHRFMLIMALVFSLSATADSYYCDPSGKDTNPGTISSPVATIEKLASLLRPGDIGFIRGGVYRSTKGNSSGVHCSISNKSGSILQPIIIQAYPGEFPIFNLDNISPTNSDPWAMIVTNCSYLTIKKLRITGLKQISSGSGVSRGIETRNCTWCTFDQIELDHIGGYGFIVGNGTYDCTWVNCDAHHMDDRLTNDGGAWGNANGFQCTGATVASRCFFIGCRAWWISDDGFDLYKEDGDFTFINCWAFWNGFEPGTYIKRGDGRGFKLGPTNTSQKNNLIRKVIGCLSFENASVGFDQNNGDCRYQVFNNTSFKNPEVGFMYDYITPAPVQDFRNNLSFQDGQPRRGKECDGITNSWQILTPSSSDFASINSAGVDGPRADDGSLPVLSFLHLSANSKLIDKGTVIPDRPYSNNSADLGAFELTANTVTTTQFTFNGGFISGRKANLSWNASVSANTKAFVIQVNKRGKFTDFATILPVIGKSEYKYLAALNIGTNIFRLKVIDNSGTIQTSDQVTITYLVSKNL